jgi:hypothetical protein
VIQVHLFGNNANWQNFVNGLPGMDLTQMTKVSQLDTPVLDKSILFDRLAPQTINASGSSYQQFSMCIKYALRVLKLHMSIGGAIQTMHNNKSRY